MGGQSSARQRRRFSRCQILVQRFVEMSTTPQADSDIDNDGLSFGFCLTRYRFRIVDFVRYLLVSGNANPHRMGGQSSARQRGARKSIELLHAVIASDIDSDGLSFAFV